MARCFMVRACIANVAPLSGKSLRWRSQRGDRQAVLHDFKQLARPAEIVVSDQVLEFPERSVLLAKGSRRQFSRSGLLLNCISELRKERARNNFRIYDAVCMTL
jgi:hypothetical protein